MDEFEQRAERQIDRLETILQAQGLKSVRLPSLPMATEGVAAAWGPEDFAIVGVSGIKEIEMFTITSCVLANVPTHNRGSLLEACNTATSNQPSFPTFLHDAAAGWSVLVQQEHHLVLALENPDYFTAMFEHVARTPRRRREDDFAAGDLGGSVLTWSEEAVEYVFARSQF